MADGLGAVVPRDWTTIGRDVLPKPGCSTRSPVLNQQSPLAKTSRNNFYSLARLSV